jgi:hypothetical protein
MVGGGRKALFVQDFMIVDRPCHELVAELEGGAGVLFRQSLGEAEADLDRLYVKVGPENWPVLLAKTVEVRFGPLRRHGEVTLLAFAWQATGSGSLFPARDGDLELSPLGETRTELTLRGRYQPPGGALGRRVDELLLHRLADATVRAFLSSLAGRLAAGAGAPAIPAATPSGLTVDGHLP